MKWCLQRHFFIIPYFTQFSTALFVKKFPFFWSFCQDSIPHARNKRCDLDPSSEVVLLKFLSLLLKSNMDQRTVRDRQAFCFQQPFALRFYPCSDDFSDEGNLKLNNFMCSSLKIIAFFSCSYISRAFRRYRVTLDNEARQLLAYFRPTSSVASYRFA